MNKHNPAPDGTLSNKIDPWPAVKALDWRSLPPHVRTPEVSP